MSDKFCNFLITKHRAQSYGETWAEYREVYNKNNGIYALQEKISLLKNHPSEIFNFMVVSGSPRLGKILVLLLLIILKGKLPADLPKSSNSN